MQLDRIFSSHVIDPYIRFIVSKIVKNVLSHSLGKLIINIRAIKQFSLGSKLCAHSSPEILPMYGSTLEGLDHS